jgi:hypothetical protein
MISKLVPPLSKLTGLVMATSFTINDVASVLLFVPISKDTKLGGSYLK